MNFQETDSERAYRKLEELRKSQIGDFENSRRGHDAEKPGLLALLVAESIPNSTVDIQDIWEERPESERLLHYSRPFPGTPVRPDETWNDQGKAIIWQTQSDVTLLRMQIFHSGAFELFVPLEVIGGEFTADFWGQMLGYVRRFSGAFQAYNGGPCAYILCSLVGLKTGEITIRACKVKIDQTSYLFPPELVNVDHLRMDHTRFRLSHTLGQNWKSDP